MLLIVVTTVSFLGLRQLVPAPRGEAEGPEREPWWFVEVSAVDDQLERLDGTLNGIRIGPDVDIQNTLVQCPGAYEQVAGHEKAPAAISAIPGYLPSGTEFVNSVMVLCDGRVISAEAKFFARANSDEGRLGGRIQVYRYEGERSWRFDGAAARTRVGEIGDRPSVIVGPITADGLGLSAVFINEPWGLSIVRAHGLPDAELVRVAESLSTGNEEARQ